MSFFNQENKAEIVAGFMRSINPPDPEMMRIFEAGLKNAATERILRVEEAEAKSTARWDQFLKFAKDNGLDESSELYKLRLKAYQASMDAFADLKRY